LGCVKNQTQPLLTKVAVNARIIVANKPIPAELFWLWGYVVPIA